MNYLDLFSGIGGFHKGLEEAGFKFNWTGHSEIDKYAKSIYQGHFKESEDLGDVSNIDVRELPRAKKWIVTGGWPCQDNSIAGKRKGQRGSTRSGLLSQIIRLIRELIEMGAEVVFIGENVKGLFSVNDGVDFIDSIRGLTYLDKDSPQLTLEMQLLNTLWFLPQNRERIYFVGYSRGRAPTRALFFESQSLPRNTEQSKKERKRFAPSLTGGAPFSRTGNERVEIDAMVVTPFDMKAFGEYGEGQTSPTLKSRDYKDATDLVVHGTQDPCLSGSAFALGRNNGQENVVLPIHDKATRFQSGGARQENGVQYDDGAGNGLGIGEKGGPCYTITSGDRHSVFTNARVRRLTPLECERLQGFPDGWTEYGKDDELISDTQRYKCLGNAVSVPVVKAVGDRLNET